MTNYSPPLPIEELETARSSPSSPTFTLYRRALQRKAWLIGGITGITTVAAFVWSSFTTLYTGNFYLLVEPITSAAKLSDPSTLARTGGVPQDDLFSLDYPTNLAFLQSPGMTNRIARAVNEKIKDRSVPAIWKDLRENFTVSRVGGDARSTATKIFEVSYQGKSVREVQTILNIAADTFIKYSSEDRETSLKSGVRFIDKQLPGLQKRLADLQAKQQKLRENYDLIDPTTKGQEVLTRIQDLDKQQQDIENQLNAQKALYASLQKQLSLTPSQALAAVTLGQDPQRLALVNKLQEIDAQIATESARFTEDSPILQNLREQRQNVAGLLDRKTKAILRANSIAESDAVIADGQNPVRLELIQQMVTTNNQIRTLEVQNNSLIADRKALETTSKRYPDVINEYQELDRQIKLTQDILDRLQTQRETLKVESAQELPWQLISQPQIPIDADGNPIPTPPKRTRKLAFGFGAGLVFSTLLALYLEKRRNVFYTPEDIATALNQPLMAEIPYDETKREEFQESSPLSLGGFAFETAFHTLYTKLLLSYKDNPPRSLVVSSLGEKEGQTTLALHLALAAASTGKRVLLVDANWQNPRLHEWFNIPNQKGLYQILTLAVDPPEVIQTLPDYPHLSVLTSGIEESIQKKRLWSPIMQEVMNTLAGKYELVIYDVPHFFDSTDVNFFIDKSDGVLFLATALHTDAAKIHKVRQDLEKYSLPCLGVVVNHLSDEPVPIL